MHNQASRFSNNNFKTNSKMNEKVKYKSIVIINKLIISVLFLLSQQLAAQNVGIGTTTPDASALLDITAANKGLLIPRVALTSITDAVTVPSPANSLLVYNTTIGVSPNTLIPSYYYWNGSRWTQILSDISSGVNTWSVNGNSGTSPVVNFVGTADNQPLVFKINNNNAGYIGVNGNSFFGKNSGNPLSTGANNTAVGAGSLVNVSTGYSNVGLGTDALGRNDVISNLVAVGDSALYNNGIGVTQSDEGTQNTAIGSKVLYSNTLGFSNTALGFQAQFLNKSGYSNTSLGTKSMWSNISGDKNTTTGSYSLFSNTTGSLNTAAGTFSMNGNLTGSTNTGIGYAALALNTYGNANVALGSYALHQNSYGSNIVAIGDSALYLYSGSNIGLPPLFGNNTAVGSKVLFSSTTGTSNSAFGSQAMYYNTTGNLNVAVGGKSLFSNTTGAGNTAVGVVSMRNNSSGAGNTAIGYGSLYGNNSTGNNNIAVGASALSSNGTGNANIAMGHRSMYSITTGSHNIAIGTSALELATNADNSVAIGDSAMYNFNVGGTNYNTAVGTTSLFKNVNGGGNTAIGYRALYENKASSNTAVGDLALSTNDFGEGNTGLGVFSLWKSYGDHNSAVGANSLINNTRGDGNAVLGADAMFNNTLGNKNVAIGISSLAANITGSKNTVVGYKSNVSSAGLLNATAIGANALVACDNCMSLGSIIDINGANANTKVGIGTTTPQTTLNVDPNGSGGILIGYDKYAGGYTTLEMGISAGSNGRSYIQSTKASGSTFGDLSLNPQGGNVGIHMNTPLSPLHIKQTTDTYPVVGGGLRLERNANTNHWEMATDSGDDLDFTYNNVAKAYINNVNGLLVSPSDLRLKKDINSIGTVLPAMMQLQPKTYHYKTNEDGSPLSYGFIAQEVEKLFPDFVVTKGPDNMKAIIYQEFTIIAIKAIQEQQAIIELQNKRIEKLEQQMEAVLKSKE